MSHVYFESQNGPYTNAAINDGVFSPSSILNTNTSRAWAQSVGSIGRILDLQITADAAHSMEIWWSPFAPSFLPAPRTAVNNYVLLYDYAGRQYVDPFNEPDDSGRTLQKPFNLSASGPVGGSTVAALGGALQFVSAYAGVLRTHIYWSVTPAGGNLP